MENTNVKPKYKVVAALIVDGNKFLICKRPYTKARGGLWEFVGGKVEKGEALTKALIRECYEELKIEIEPQGLFYSLTHNYDDIDIELYLFKATITGGTLTLTEHIDARWIGANEIKDYEFCPADYEILDKIRLDFSAL